MHSPTLLQQFISTLDINYFYTQFLVFYQIYKISDTALKIENKNTYKQKLKHMVTVNHLACVLFKKILGNYRGIY